MRTKVKKTINGVLLLSLGEGGGDSNLEESPQR